MLVRQLGELRAKMILWGEQRLTWQEGFGDLNPVQVHCVPLAASTDAQVRAEFENDRDQRGDSVAIGLRSPIRTAISMPQGLSTEEF